MNQRDQDLLDKQLWSVSTHPPAKAGALGLTFICAFLVGLSIGGVLFAQSNQTPTRDTLAELALSGNSSSTLR